MYVCAVFDTCVRAFSTLILIPASLRGRRILPFILIVTNDLRQAMEEEEAGLQATNNPAAAGVSNMVDQWRRRGRSIMRCLGKERGLCLQGRKAAVDNKATFSPPASASTHAPVN